MKHDSKKRLKNIPISKLKQIIALGTSADKDKKKGVPEQNKQK